MLSALMTTPPSASARSIASADLPLPLGPAMIRTKPPAVILIPACSRSESRHAQYVLEQHLEEEHGGDAAEQQPHEIGISGVVAEADGMPGDEAGGGEEQPVDQRAHVCLSPQHLPFGPIGCRSDAA